MMFSSSLQECRRQPEIMDQPDLEEQRHRQALLGLERINRWTGSARLLWPAIRQAALESAPVPLRVLDIATGAADAPVRLWHRAKRAGIPLEISACDRSLTALKHGQRGAEQHGVPIHFFPWDILSGPLPESYDVVMCSLFLHHLAEEEVVQVLRTMAQAARRLVLVQDLRRCAMGWWLAYLGTRLLSSSPIVHFDGPVSVEGAFTDLEIARLAQRAGLPGARVTRHWPCRFLLTWWKS